MTTLNIQTIRKQFPILDRVIHDYPLVYLDNAATTQKPYSVLGTLDHYYQHYNANIHRGIHTLAEEATAAYELARDKTQRFINAPKREEIIFVRNTTEAINLIAYTWAEQNIGEGDEILISELEHHSNIIPWQLVAKRKNALLKYIPITEDGDINYEAYEKLLSSKTKLVAITQASNVLGTIVDIPKISKLAHEKNALVLVDAAQSIPHRKVDVQQLRCDFLAFSGHKMYGPMGIGVLWARAELLEAMPPFLGGGEMIREVSWQSAKWNELPYKFEAGTPYVSGSIGLGAAIDFIESIGIDEIQKYEQELTSYALTTFEKFPDLTVYGPQERGAVIAFTHKEIHPHDLSALLDSEGGVATRSGHHCAMPLASKLGIHATCRISFGIYNTKDEIDIFFEALGKAEEAMQCKNCTIKNLPCCKLKKKHEITISN
ncbi:MAG: cysteine desulfurase [bacterium]